MAGEDNAQMALARSLSEKIEDTQLTWSKVTASRRTLGEPEPIVLTMRQVERLSVPAQMILDTMGESGIEDVSTIPTLSRDEIAVMLLRLQESGLNLDF